MGSWLSTVALKLAMDTLLAPLSKMARNLLSDRIREWYRACLQTEKASDDATARSVAYVLGIDLSDIDEEYASNLAHDVNGEE